MPSTVTLKASGLNTSQNQLELPEGALSEATNVIIRRQDVIESRPGFKLFGTSFGTITDRLKQIFVYKNRLIRHFGTVMQFDSGKLNNAGLEQFLDFAGSFDDASPGLRMKTVESNGNLYFTTSDGIQKISAKTANDFSTSAAFITKAGGITALDITAQLNLQQGNQTGFLPQDSTVAYRVVWGKKDANNNLDEGVPSQRAELYNPLINLLIGDFNNTVQAIQNTADEPTPNASLINDPDYSSLLSLPPNATANDLNSKLQVLTAKLDADLLLANDTGAGTPLTISAVSIVNNNPNNLATITFSSGDPSQYFQVGSSILLKGFPTGEGTDITTNSINTVQTISALTSTTLSFLTTAAGNQQSFSTSSVSTTTPWAITLPSHGFIDRDPVKFTTTGTLPAPLTTGTIYYIGNSTTDTFQVYSDSSLTTQVQFTTTGSGAGTVTYFMPVTGTSINSNTFTAIPIPVVPASPATDDDLVSQQTYLSNIIVALQSEPSSIISAYSQTTFIVPLTITTTANADLYITIPPDANSTYFFQIYRSPILQATGVAVLSQLSPSDELQQVYEAFPTPAELALGIIHVLDITPDSFAGANLYTNEQSGEGLANANEAPPFALDINRFKNVVFYANTRTKFLESISLLGVSKLIADANNNITPSITISNGVKTNTYTFVLGVNQVTSVTTVADIADSLNGTYWLISTADSTQTQYYVWYKTSGGTSTNPMVANSTGIEVFVNTGDSADDVATKTAATLNNYFVSNFTTTVATDVMTITNTVPGSTTAPSAGTSGFTVTVTTTGVGQNAAAKQVLLSNAISPAQAVEATAKSLIEVINKNANETVIGIYTSSATSVPGQFELESRDLNDPQFYIVANNANTGSSFNPDISPSNVTVTSIAPGTPATNLVTVSAAHGLVTGEQVFLVGTNSTPKIDGLQTITYVSPTSFRVNTNIMGAGTTGSIITADNAVAGSDEEKINRIYYSKLQQPEAVPLGNTLDVGASDKAILRIFPLRDSLFVFKEDGLYRISGEVAPFNLALFDSSCVLIAPDSVDVTNNTIFAWTTAGIVAVTEAGVSYQPAASRPIDNRILQLNSDNYPNFNTATWGIGYNSDNSYTVFTVQTPNDTMATIAYRYSTLTNTWTNYAKTDTCGVVNVADDKLYLGAGDINFLEQERKTFSRLDYADRELPSTINDGNYAGATIKVPDVSQFAIGDVIVQDQLLTPFTFNGLLEKLDIDTALLSSPITSISLGVLPTITTSNTHLLSVGDSVQISGTNTTPNIDGIYTVATTPSATTFTISTKKILTAGTTGLAKYLYYETLAIAGGANLSDSFGPLVDRLNIEPSLLYKASSGSIVNNTIANPTVVTTSAPHGLGIAGTTRLLTLSGVATSTPSINGNHTVTIVSDTEFSLPVNVTVAGTGGSYVTYDDYLSIVDSRTGSITNNTSTSPTIVTSANHGLYTGRVIQIASSNSSPVIDGIYPVVTIDANNFSIPVDVLISGTSGNFITLNENFKDIQAVYNKLIDTLNEDSGLNFNNYSHTTNTTSLEAVIIGINKIVKSITLNLTLDLVVGPLTVYKAIPTSFTYAPVTFKDSLSLKQIYEATLMFDNKAFTSAVLSFASDLLPELISIVFNGDGNGIFGMGTGPFGGGFFGGASNSAPFRTYIPRDKQRCRYLIAQFKHQIAREQYAINGLTLTGNTPESSRAYR